MDELDDALFSPLGLPSVVPPLPFPEQDRFVDDSARRLAALCTRQAGKSYGLARKFLRTMERFPRSLSRYIALTQDSARNIMWSSLKDEVNRNGVQANFNETRLEMTLANGARLQLLGADSTSFIDRLRGVKCPAVAIDEAQGFRHHLKHLVNEVIVPTMAFYGDQGWLALCGTPGPIPQGYWYEVTQANLGKFKLFKWSIHQNPYIPDPASFLKEQLEANNWDEESPPFKREYRGLWVLDQSDLFIRWTKELNDYSVLPSGRWKYITGIDVGVVDSNALATIGWREEGPEIYLIEEDIASGDDMTASMHRVMKVRQKYKPIKLPMDPGGAGKMLAEELRRRHAIPITTADTKRKMENAMFLNDYLRRGLFKAKSTSRFVHDAAQVQIDRKKSSPTKTVLMGLHSDVIDAVLYAFKESPAWSYKAAIPKPAVGTKEYFSNLEDEMEERDADYIEQEREQDYAWNNDPLDEF